MADNKKYIKLTNGTGALAKLVAGASCSDETHRVFLKNAGGETLCSILCASEEDARAELTLINEQMGW